MPFNIFFDIVSPFPETMRFALDFTNTVHLIYSGDHPWVDPAIILDCLRSLDLSPEDEKKYWVGMLKICSNYEFGFMLFLEITIR